MKITKIETNLGRNLYFSVTENLSFSSSPLYNLENQVLKIYPGITFQTILGFGGAFTESSGYNLKSISSSLSEQILDDYFSEDGLRYSLGRLPIGSCDFSLDSYSYSSQNDLSDFSIQRDLGIYCSNDSISSKAK